MQGIPARWRDFHTAVGIGPDMYVFGGRSDQGGNMFTNVELYCNKIQTFNTVTNTWSEPATHGLIPTGRRSHSVCKCEPVQLKLYFAFVSFCNIKGMVDIIWLND